MAYGQEFYFGGAGGIECCPPVSQNSFRPSINCFNKPGFCSSYIIKDTRKKYAVVIGRLKVHCLSTCGWTLNQVTNRTWHKVNVPGDQSSMG